MSIQAFKKKGVIQYGNKISGKGPPTEWIRGGPNQSKNGFSINGGFRSGTYIGKSSAFSKVVTPYLGRFPRDYCLKPKSEIIFGTPSQVRCIQLYYTKPSVLSFKGMIETQYLCCKNLVEKKEMSALEKKLQCFLK